MGGRQYPDHPRVGVGGVIFNDQGQVLLILRGARPMRGLWSIPGGLLDIGETLVEGVAREVLEETGLEVTVGPHVTTFERILRDEQDAVQYHYVLVDFLCEAPTGSVPRAASDAVEARFVDVEDLGDYETTPSVARVVQEALALRQQ